MPSNDDLKVEGREYEKGYSGYGSVHYDQTLNNFSVWAMPQTETFIANKAIPTIPVGKMSDKFDFQPPQEFFTIHEDERAEKSDANEVYWNTDEREFKAKIYSLRTTRSVEKKANDDNPALSDRKDVLKVVRGLQLGAEKRFAAKFMTGTGWATAYSGVATTPTGKQILQWNDPVSDPATDINNLKKEFHLQTYGIIPNAAIMTYDVFHALRNNPAIKDYLSSATRPNLPPAQIDMAGIMYALGLEKLFLMNVVINKNNLGVPEKVDGKIIKSEPEYMASKTFLLYNYSTSVIEGDGMGAIFSPRIWGGFNNGAPAMRRYWNGNSMDYENIRGDWAYTMEITNPTMAIPITNVIA